MPDADATTLIFETLHGSRAYGLATEGSDEDIKGVIVGPRAWYLGYLRAPEQLDLGKDHVRYELRKLVHLGAKGNPTLLELLWTDPADHRVLTPAGEQLLAHREAFLSQRVRDTFGQYAMAQLRRIKTHRRWLLAPPRAEPTRADFGLPERTVVPRDQLGAAEAMLADGRLEADTLSPNFLAALDRERRYRAARREWEQHRHWKKTRNPARAALEREHGYDTKHAQHLVRLLRMGREILETGAVMVRRPDREELLAIRRGLWSYDELIEQAEALHRAVDAAAVGSTLPRAPDEGALNALCVDIIARVLGGGI